MPSIPSQEDIEQQQERLAEHRATLAVYLGQLAKSGSAYAPLPVVKGIAEVRIEIKRIKGILRDWGVPVKDLPDDEEPIEEYRDAREMSSSIKVIPELPD